MIFKFSALKPGWNTHRAKPRGIHGPGPPGAPEASYSLCVSRVQFGNMHHWSTISMRGGGRQRVLSCGSVTDIVFNGARSQIYLHLLKLPLGL